MKDKALVDAPLHTTWSGRSLTSGVGLMVMVNVWAVPVHPTAPPVKSGVTVRVAMTGDVKLLSAVNEGMFPAPENEIPIEGVLFVQV